MPSQNETRWVPVTGMVGCTIASHLYVGSMMRSIFDRTYTAVTKPERHPIRQAANEPYLFRICCVHKSISCHGKFRLKFALVNINGTARKPKDWSKRTFTYFRSKVSQRELLEWRRMKFSHLFYYCLLCSASTLRHKWICCLNVHSNSGVL